ncbi:MAG: hypothetical protein J5959_03315 [Butyrivibrio sp.]|nr:hypothetical protein [Butyrivibrio sp.]
MGHFIDNMGDSEEDKKLFGDVETVLLRKEKGHKDMADKEFKQIHINFAQGLVSDPFKGKDGKDYVQIWVPNQDKDDKSPWATFVQPAYKVKVNEKSTAKKKGVFIYLPEEGTTTLRKDTYLGENADGKKEWQHDTQKVPNKELKKMLEAWKQKESVIGKLDAKKDQAKEAAKDAPEKEKSAPSAER